MAAVLEPGRPPTTRNGLEWSVGEVLSCGPWRRYATVEAALGASVGMARYGSLLQPDIAVITAIASDHSPHDQDSKRLPFAQADFGIVGLETLLPLSLALVHKGEIGLLELLSRLTSRPAAILGLPGGRLVVGAAADLVLFDLDAPGRIEPARFRSKSKNSPFEEHLVQGCVLRTVVDGRSIYEAAG